MQCPRALGLLFPARYGWALQASFKSPVALSSFFPGFFLCNDKYLCRSPSPRRRSDPIRTSQWQAGSGSASRWRGSATLLYTVINFKIRLLLGFFFSDGRYDTVRCWYRWSCFCWLQLTTVVFSSCREQVREVQHRSEASSSPRRRRRFFPWESLPASPVARFATPCYLSF